ncbi:MAG: hypothetical protein K2N06_05445 [Oscillospiraceae bacterium]|nr:hypothetical protein [Oscillospiraceae bacterium]
MGRFEDKTLESLCGEHTFSGCELIEEDGCGVCLFTLDNITYKAIEDPDDGYRSFCNDIQISEQKPNCTFPGIRVLYHMMEDDNWGCNNVLVIRDILNGKIILEVGTKNTGDYYPYCHFHYTPENMACNQSVVQTEKQ